jgi:hypothetical protein
MPPRIGFPKRFSIVALMLGRVTERDRLDGRCPNMSDDYDGLLENYRNAWDGLRMIREAVETLGPPGVLLSRDGVLREHGREPIHEAEAIVNALTTMAAEADKLRKALHLS